MTGKRRMRTLGRDEPADANLDDLFGLDESAPAPAARRERWLGKLALQTAASSVLVYMGFYLLNLAPPVPLVVAVCGCVVVARRAVRLTAEARPNRTAEIIRPRHRVWHSPGEGWLIDGDGVRDAVRRWDRRLEWGTRSLERYRSSVAGRLADLASERIRQRHGFSPAQDPQRARQLLGETTWRVLFGAQEAAPTLRDLSAAIERLESV